MKLSLAALRQQRSLIFLVVLGVLGIVRLWILPLGNSYWLDETLIAAIARKRFSEVGVAAYHANQPILFSYIEWLMRQFDGVNEAIMRIPSLLGAAGGVYIFYRIGAEFLDREAGLIYALLFVALPQIAPEASNVRPYSLGLFFYLLALLTLLRWQRDGWMRDGLWFAVYTALAAIFHPFFLLTLPCETLYLVFKWSHERPKLIHQISCAALLLLACILPLTIPNYRFMKMRSVMEFPSEPTVFGLVTFMFPLLLVVGSFIGWLVAPADKTFYILKAQKDHLILGVLLLVPALVVFGASAVWHLNLFVPRYMLCSAPGVILVWGSLLASMRASRVRRMTLAGGLLLSAGLTGGFTFIPDAHGEEWRSAVYNLPPSDRLLVYSGLAETRQLDWLRDLRHWDYLISPVAVYRPEVT